ncbi:hypothetical protein NOVOSPHI9U_560004 [Novosphingobium sp. 9U]|nr:hypothetical protein NOVOSPHI9U_560004 [Novosphingobium sp. 9U]
MMYAMRLPNEHMPRTPLTIANDGVDGLSRGSYRRMLEEAFSVPVELKRKLRSEHTLSGALRQATSRTMQRITRPA